ncbi:hypothetical protein DWU98_10130 [Dyella monticola]|uniref:Uncharacterized protein n=1 Tax=Dyella monticola TaxID=1927958 RepID=A0A370WZQ4_9GAMM|nr:hypothetical protein [Dyella monticola]RDS81582.1 hypothetical protein DWU98_10130 [Dyella monticola]
MRWVLLVATLLSWVLCFTRQGAGAMAIWLFAGIVGAMGTVLAFVQARIDAHAQPEIMLEPFERRADHDPAPRP